MGFLTLSDGKPIWQSNTVQGIALWAIDIFLKGIGLQYPYLSPLLETIGTFLAGVGIRNAITQKPSMQ